MALISGMAGNSHNKTKAADHTIEIRGIPDVIPPARGCPERGEEYGSIISPQRRKEIKIT
jgi:hypothetical protein